MYSNPLSPPLLIYSVTIRFQHSCVVFWCWILLSIVHCMSIYVHIFLSPPFLRFYNIYPSLIFFFFTFFLPLPTLCPLLSPPSNPYIFQPSYTLSLQPFSPLSLSLSISLLLYLGSLSLSLTSSLTPYSIKFIFFEVLSVPVALLQLHLFYFALLK